MKDIFSLECINQVHIDHYANKLREFHITKNTLRGHYTNRIQAALVQLMSWNQNNELNNVPNLEETGDLNDLLTYVQILPQSGDNLIDSFQYMSSDFIEKFGLMEYSNDSVLNNKLLILMIETMKKHIFDVLLKYLSKEEFELGFQIYSLERNIPKDLFDYFLTNPGIDNFQFDVMKADIFEAMKIQNCNGFLWHLSQIGVNENYIFFYDSEAVNHYNVPTNIQNQSLEIRNQIKNAYNKINNELYYLYITD